MLLSVCSRPRPNARFAPSRAFGREHRVGRIPVGDVPTTIRETPDGRPPNRVVASGSTFQSQPPMTTEDRFCTQAGKSVRLTHSSGSSDDVAPHDAVCLDMNRRCVTDKCPVTHAPTPLMALRLARSGLPSDIRRAMALCPECDRETVHEVVGWAQAVCTNCHAVRRWSELTKR